MRTIIILAALFGLVFPLGAQELQWEELEKSTLISKRLFPPDLILECQREINLQPLQRTQILDAFRELQSGETADLQVRLLETTVGLDSLLTKALVDQTEALTQIDRILEAERLLKRLHLKALIEIKNVLNHEQQQFLTNVQEARKLVVEVAASGELKTGEDPNSGWFYVYPARARRPACGGSG